MKELKEMYYAIYDAKTTTGYKCLGVVKVPVAGAREAAYQIVHDVLGLNKEDIWIQLSVEIQHKLHPLN